ncbi:hypothetical protein [Bacillus arachidis]|uniref:hypothetical protein n=1 Tax=Bacillus arachidis TaxID=2819290 RepID=UPI00255C2D0D|nr:hypothetical protein [Bacillus arachidis]WIY60603.1 hypothetical protein QRY57_22725 [Bacillus arachidis]
MGGKSSKKKQKRQPKQQHVLQQKEVVIEQHEKPIAIILKVLRIITIFLYLGFCVYIYFKMSQSHLTKGFFGELLKIFVGIVEMALYGFLFLYIWTPSDKGEQGKSKARRRKDSSNSSSGFVNYSDNDCSSSGDSGGGDCGGGGD